MAQFQVLSIAVLCLIVGKSASNWIEGGDDLSYGNMGFYAKNLVCNDEQDYCQDCFTVRARGKVFLHTFEYATNPNKYQLAQLEGDEEWKITMIQEDKSDIFHMCTTLNRDGQVGDSQQLTVCMENDSSGVEVPDDCTSPVALVSLSDKVSNMRLSGQQVLYCAQ